MSHFRKKFAATVCAALLPVATLLPSNANAAGLIRDAETESLIRAYAGPIFRVAGLSKHNVQIHIVGQNTFNAFVVDGQNMFIHVGAIMNSKTPNQLIGVIAHEAGHITGGHLARLRTNLARARSASIMLQILGVAAMAAGALTGAGGDLGEAGAAIMYGGQSVTQRNVLAYRRAEESAADQAALTFLNATRQSARGMLETFEYFADQGMTSLRYVDPYVQSHPMPRQRIAQLRSAARSSPYFKKADSPHMQLRHDLMRAKLVGFLQNPQTVFNKYPRSDSSLPARYARAIATYRQSGLRNFLPQIDALIREKPKNPFFLEIKGQFLFEGGKARAAIAPLRKSVSLAPREPLIRTMLGQALLSTGSNKDLDEAIGQFRKAIAREPHSALAYKHLATALGRKAYATKGGTQKKYIARAELASAHAYLYQGRVKLAKQQATRARDKFRRGTTQWVQADDIMNYKPPQ